MIVYTNVTNVFYNVISVSRWYRFMDDITKNPEYNKFREVCRSIQQAGEDCLEELIRMDKSSRTEVDKLYTSLGIGYEPCLNTRKDYL